MSVIDCGVSITSTSSTWTTIPYVSDYTIALNDHPLPAVDFGPPTTAVTTIDLWEPAEKITGIRLIGSEGGPARNGFLGVFELEVEALPGNSPEPTLLLNPAASGAQFRFEFDSQVGITHVVRSRASLTEDWQVHATICRRRHPEDGQR